jgi:hypothetical protein
MLQGERQNIHHSKLPQPGEVGRILGLPLGESRRRCIVSHYPLCNNVPSHSRGIHTVWIRFLDNGELRRIRGIRLQIDDRSTSIWRVMVGG